MTAENQFERTKMLLGEEAVRRLSHVSVCVLGLGGVGGSCAETLARAGIGRLTLVDGDVVELTNLNRQVVALHSTLGKSKADALAARLADINPHAEITAVKLFYLPETAGQLNLASFDYVVDAVDTVTAKVDIISRCAESHTRIISCMGTGNKLDPLAFRVADISATCVCPLAKVMRRELKKRGIASGLKVLFSEEPALVPVSGASRTPASAPFVPPVAGMLLAREVILDLAEGRWN